MSSIKFFIFLAFVSSALIPMSALSVYAQQTFTLQVHPYLPASELLNRFAPLTDYLSTKTSRKIICNISKDYQDHIDKIGNDEVDIAYLGPASYVKVTKTYGLKPILVRLEINGTPSFRGVIVTRKSSTITTLKNLAGKRFAFGDPNSTMSHLVPLFMLYEAGINKDNLAGYKFLDSHHNVALGVLVGDFDAGAIKEEVFYKYKDRGLKDLQWTPKISEHIFVVRSSLPKKTINELKNALLSLRNEPDSKSIMSSIKNNMTAMVPARDEDYNNLRNILNTVESTELNQ
jgi:phosphonate transport system substrate-binding protein